ncbi:hypothetical protein BCR39DRAFT_531569 [Naematelia encephala]|uniref:[histone H3]-dimethyl-L-lysine(36) demethylase n=1 Tax=Naematelia encephala TaxID=71784 RepID=A0A1Y2B4A6_9TREE|nr:hypothetical protein BCR39DRAFT_531569 [Naematelia encephala]
MTSVKESSPEERCALCPLTGPPARTKAPPSTTIPPEQIIEIVQPPASDTSLSRTSPFSIGLSSLQRTTLPPTPPETSANDDSFHWIACSNCDVWYHSVCILLGGDEWARSVPEEIRKEIEVNDTGEGAWTNWTGWVGRWYCKVCIDQENDPTSSHPRHHPLIATLKKGFPPKPKGAPRLSKSLKRSPSSTTIASAASPGTSKKRRITGVITRPLTPNSIAMKDSGVERKPDIHRDQKSEEFDSDVDMLDDRGEGSSKSAILPTSRATENRPVTPVMDASSRPKRQAALNRPDYHALHNHDAAPTSRWLALIADPERYGATIKPDDFPRIPASLLSRDWIESSNATTRHSATSLDPASQEGLPTSKDPPDFSPSLFYGSMREPLVVRKEDGGFEGLGGRLPGKDLTVADVARLVGPDVQVPVIDVNTQKSSQWPLSRWAEYIYLRSHPVAQASNADMEILRGKTYNIISLEITGTDLAKRVRPPRLVREVDWVDLFWNFGPDGKPGEVAALRGEMDGTVVTAEGGGELRHALTGRKGKTASWPKVQLYCLMGTKGSWTDWHVDFAASSVYYTVHSGAKTFFFIRPTEKNLKAYTAWCGSSELQHTTWLGSMCDDDVRKVTLNAGDTMIIPSGYIHAVYTPLDSIVFGGNFLHSYDIPTQLRLRQIEIDTKVPPMFRFPQLDKLCWYVADRYCSDLRHLRAYRPRSTANPSPPHPRILIGLAHLARFLSSQVAILEDETAEDKTRKSVYDKIPTDVVRDPAGLAKELAWRVERELALSKTLDVDADGELEVKWNGDAKEPRNGKKRVHGSKHKTATETGLRMLSPVSRTDNFFPPPWSQDLHPVDREVVTVKLPRPDKTSNHTNEYAEEAKQERKVIRQSRTRVRYLEDGRVIQEEQDVVFTETRISWPESRVNGTTATAAVNGNGDRVHGVDQDVKNAD